MKLLRDWEVHVNIDGVALEEWQTEVDPLGTFATCYIASEAGKVRVSFACSVVASESHDACLSQLSDVPVPLARTSRSSATNLGALVTSRLVSSWTARTRP
jgi:hypothetical protein